MGKERGRERRRKRKGKREKERERRGKGEGEREGERRSWGLSLNSREATISFQYSTNKNILGFTDYNIIL